jgi:hypothetical protein
MRRCADKLDADEPLEKGERFLVAAVVRAHAERMKTKRPRPPGKRAKVPDTFPMFFYDSIESGKFASKNKALDYFAGHYGVSIEALKKRLQDPAIKRLLKTLQYKT